MPPRFAAVLSALAIGLSSAVMPLAAPAVADPDHAAALGEPGSPAASARVVTILMNDEMRFVPAAITVRRGETIRFVVRNAGAIRHEMTLGTAAELKAHAAMMEQHPDMRHADPNSVTVEPGGSRMMLWNFSKAGVFDFACLEPGHMQAGMTGRITVR